jgi:hypothetical protein
MRIRDFKGRRANPIVPLEEFPELETGTQNIASSPAMCFSCHDGFVMDSRTIWSGGTNHSHPIGMPPPADIVIPLLDSDPAFPLNDDGNMYCGTCHSGHLSTAANAPKKVKPFLRASADGELCRACHADKTTIDGSAHDRGRRRSQDFESRGTCVNRLCRSCHADAPMPSEHPPHVVAWSQEIRGTIFSNTPGEMPVFDEHGRQQRVGNIGCPTCHNVHRERAEGRPDNLPGKHLRLAEFVEPLCADCHGPDSLFFYKFFHSAASRK